MQFSILQLKHLNAEQFAAGREKLSKVRSVTIEILGVKNPELSAVSFYLVNGYLVARLGFGVFCECGDFKHRNDACKHIAAIMPAFCESCRESASEHGECSRCGIKNAVYLKERKRKPVEKIGGIRI